MCVLPTGVINDDNTSARSQFGHTRMWNTAKLLLRELRAAWPDLATEVSHEERKNVGGSRLWTRQSIGGPVRGHTIVSTVNGDSDTVYCRGEHHI